MKRFEITLRFDAEDYPAAIKRVAKLLAENHDFVGTGIQGAEPTSYPLSGNVKVGVGIEFPNPNGYPIMNPTPERVSND